MLQIAEGTVSPYQLDAAEILMGQQGGGEENVLGLMEGYV
jgi:hypothetical protein